MGESIFPVGDSVSPVVLIVTCIYTYTYHRMVNAVGFMIVTRRRGREREYVYIYVCLPLSLSMILVVTICRVPQSNRRCPVLTSRGCVSSLRHPP
jgi:hypothetical protein